MKISKGIAHRRTGLESEELLGQLLLLIVISAQYKMMMVMGGWSSMPFFTSVGLRLYKILFYFLPSLFQAYPSTPPLDTTWQQPVGDIMLQSTVIWHWICCMPCNKTHVFCIWFKASASTSMWNATSRQPHRWYHTPIHGNVISNLLRVVVQLMCFLYLIQGLHFDFYATSRQPHRWYHTPMHGNVTLNLLRTFV